ncbi:MAG: Dna2/Cas4 domain-containing protein, partial [Coprobacillus cateniformis]|nr:Dna2/Cas4 domain-containing protein [Coprobacillus cateniformis]
RQNVICEVKKSSSQKQMAIHQLKYYLYLLKKKGIKASGELLIPKENVKEKINFEDDDVKNIERQLNRISEICSQQSPPEIINKKICKKCAYFELCYI